MNADAIVQAIKLAMDCIEEAARTPGGAPSGVVYAALSEHGMTLNVYQQILQAMVNAGKVKVSDHHLITACN